jgi:hypothetical protein
MAPPVDLESVINDITTSTSPQLLLASLRSLVKRDVGDAILASVMPGGQDPLSVLDTHANTLGYLFILCAGYSGLYYVAFDSLTGQHGFTSWARRQYRSPQSHFSVTPSMLKLHG